MVRTAADIVQALDHYYAQREVFAFAELRIGTGYGKDAEQRLDYWVLEPTPSRRFRRVAYEIKVSRDDLRHELRHPRKRARALLLSNEFYFITPPGLVHEGELPPEAGLVEVEQRGGGLGLYVRHPAPWRDGYPPTWQFLAAVVRRASR